MKNKFRKSRFLFVSLLALIVSCSPKEVPPPNGTIPPDSMIKVLADVHLAESRLLLNGKYAGVDSLKATYIQHVLIQIGTDTGRFNKSFAYYASKPEQFSEMYDKVMAEISKRQAEKK